MSVIAGKQSEVFKDFIPSLDLLHEMLEFVKSYAIKLGLDEKQMIMLEVAVEETFVNIISYALLKKDQLVNIKCENSHSPEGIRITFTDQGIPFNPLTRPKKFDPNVIQEYTMGGIGIFFILTIMDEVAYKREKNTNILSLTMYKEKKRG